MFMMFITKYSDFLLMDHLIYNIHAMMINDYLFYKNFSIKLNSTLMLNFTMLLSSLEPSRDV